MYKKYFIGGLATKGIKAAYKAFIKSGGKKTADIVKSDKSSTRQSAKQDIKWILRQDPRLTAREKNLLKK